MDFFNQGIPLGRWFRITVVLHWTFLIWAAFQLMGAPREDLWYQALFIVLLFGTILLHEFGHALSCRAVGGEAFHIVLWPLGGLAFVQPPMNPWAWLVTTVCGPLVNAILWPVFWAMFTIVLPRIMPDPRASFATEFIWSACWAMLQINRMLLLFNLIPAYPMDGGRILQEVLWLIVGYPRSLQIAGMVGTVCGFGFVVLGAGLRRIDLPLYGSLGDKPNMMLVIIGVLVMMQSFGIYKRSQEIKGWRKN